jgi:long-chain acyl-CoA synthetase
MAPFKPTAGYLALHCKVDSLPVYLDGTHEALPPGGGLPRKTKLRVFIGQPIRFAELEARTAALARGDAHKAATQIMEQAVRALQQTALRLHPADGHSGDARAAPAPAATGALEPPPRRTAGPAPAPAEVKGEEAP